RVRSAASAGQSCPTADGQARHTRGHRQRGRVPGLRRSRVDHRDQSRHRRGRNGTGMSIFTCADRALFTGRLVLPGDGDFEEARVGRVFNARRPDRSPEAVLLAETEADIAAGVRLARDRGVAVAVRSGGHSWAVWSVREGTLLIELGLLRAIDYDERTGIVSASPAV